MSQKQNNIFDPAKRRWISMSISVFNGGPITRSDYMLTRSGRAIGPWSKSQEGFLVPDKVIAFS